MLQVGKLNFEFFLIIASFSISSVLCKEYFCSKLTSPEEFAILREDGTKEFKYKKCELKHVKYFDKQDSFNLNVDTEIDTNDPDDYFEKELIRKDILSVRFVSSTLWKVPNDLFMQMPYLKILDISNVGIKQLDQLSFNKGQNLLEIHMHGNELTSLEDAYFVHTKDLKVLDISSNRISNIKEVAFRSLASLESLSLSNNKLSTLDDNIFSSLGSLKWLWLDRNKLTMISSYLFSQSQENLVGAYFNGNQISAVSPFAFVNSPRLSYLMMKGNVCIDQDFKGNKIAGIAVKYEMRECIKEFNRIFPDEHPFAFNLTLTIERLKMKAEACNYETKSLKDSMKSRI